MSGVRKVNQAAWPRGDETLRRMMAQGFNRVQIAAQIARELKCRMTDDMVTSRARSIGLIPRPGEKPRVPEGFRVVRLKTDAPRSIPSAVGRSTAMGCQHPMWTDKSDPNYGRFCGQKRDGNCSYCAEHRRINLVVIADLQNKGVKDYQEFAPKKL